MIRVLEKLAAASIELLPDSGISTHFVFGRDGFIVLVERKEDGFGSIGAPALLTEQGLAVLVWRGAEAWFVGKGFEQPATAGQVEASRRFSADLKSAFQITAVDP